MHLKHWHRATRGADGDLILSSYELLEILEHLPETGPFKSAAERGGRWPISTQILAEGVNEQLRMRSSYYAMNSEGGALGFDTAPYEFVDPMLRVKKARDAVSAAFAAEQSQSAFEAALGLAPTDQEG